jgi:hypothetical protein
MHIFIDESGSFSVGTSKTNISAVGALIIADGKREFIERKYAKLRRSLPKSDGEVKGRLLNESQVARVVSMLRRSGVIFEMTAFDRWHGDTTDLEHFRRGQAEGITANLTDKMHPNLIRGVWNLRERLERMSEALLCQSLATFDVIERVVRHAPLYFSQRQPKELAKFSWVIDAKNRGAVTDWEGWWSNIVTPLLQSRFLEAPVINLKGADYSHLDRFRIPIPNYLKPHIAVDNVDDTGTNLSLILREDRRFSSDPEPGLEMVDIITNAARRALTGNLGYEGWGEIPSLMIHTKHPSLRVLRPPSASHEAKDVPYLKVLNKFRHGGRNMLAAGPKKSAR